MDVFWYVISYYARATLSQVNGLLLYSLSLGLDIDVLNVKSLISVSSVAGHAPQYILVGIGSRQSKEVNLYITTPGKPRQIGIRHKRMFVAYILFINVQVI
jgi:hypothetical protein